MSMEDLTISTDSAPDSDDEAFVATVRVVVPIVFGLVTVVGLVGNLRRPFRETDFDDPYSVFFWIETHVF